MRRTHSHEWSPLTFSPSAALQIFDSSAHDTHINTTTEPCWIRKSQVNGMADIKITTSGYDLNLQFLQSCSIYSSLIPPHNPCESAFEFGVSIPGTRAPGASV